MNARKLTSLDRVLRWLGADKVRRAGLPSFFAFFGTVLGLGGPIGFLVHEWFWKGVGPSQIWVEQKFVLAYIGLGTVFFFGFFGWMMGLLFQSLVHRELRLIRFNRQLGHLDRMKQNFLNNVVDDLRSPISLALEFMKSLSAGYFGEISPKQKTLAKNTTEELEQLDESLRHILDHKTLKKFQGRESELVDMESFLRGAIGKSELRVEETKSFQIMISSELVEMAIEQILQNAALHAPDSETTVHLKVRSGKDLMSEFSKNSPHVSNLEENQFYACVEVEDKGPGFSAKMLHYLFDPVLNLSQRNLEESNDGIRFVRDVAEWHGGVVWLESFPGQGTRVFFALPIDQSDRKKEVA